MNPDNNVPELLARMQGLLITTIVPPYYKSIFDFRREVESKVKFIKQKEGIK